MIGVLIITHGDFSKGLLSASEMLAGEQELSEAIGLYPGEGFDDFRDLVTQKISAMAEASEGDGVMVLVDLFGGSPFNAVAFASQDLIAKDVKFECLTGVSMPMLLESLLTREAMSLSELKDHCMQSAGAGIQDMLKELGLRE